VCVCVCVCARLRWLPHSTENAFLVEPGMHPKTNDNWPPDSGVEQVACTHLFVLCTGQNLSIAFNAGVSTDPHSHTHTHTQTLSHTHTHTQTFSHTQTHTHKHKHLIKHTQPHSHTLTHTPYLTHGCTEGLLGCRKGRGGLA
jgi:hypothetical protein